MLCAVFYIQPSVKDVVSFEGACSWHADCRNVTQRWMIISSSYSEPSPMLFLGIWQHIQVASKQTRYNHTSPGPPPALLSETSHRDSWLKRLFAKPKKFCINWNPPRYCMAYMLMPVVSIPTRRSLKTCDIYDIFLWTDAKACHIMRTHFRVSHYCDQNWQSRSAH